MRLYVCLCVNVCNFNIFQKNSFAQHLYYRPLSYLPVYLHHLLFLHSVLLCTPLTTFRSFPPYFHIPFTLLASFLSSFSSSPPLISSISLSLSPLISLTLMHIDGLDVCIPHSTPRRNTEVRQSKQSALTRSCSCQVKRGSVTRTSRPFIPSTNVLIILRIIKEENTSFD